MEPGHPSLLQLPSFLYGTYSLVEQKAEEEGLRCGEQYREDGSFSAPQQMLTVRRRELVVAQGVVDFYRERPAWRLYMLSNVMSHLSETLSGEWQNPFPVRDAYEAFFSQTAWGALYFAVAKNAPRSAKVTALRLQAVLRFWEPLQSVRYLFSTPHDGLTLEELMVDSCNWAMDAWCPMGEASVRARLETAAERMARATREDSLEAIFRQMPRALASARGLKHRSVVAEPAFQRERITALDARAFERVSAACTADLLALLYAWDKQLGKQ
jgi:hypothetical protein